MCLFSLPCYLHPSGFIMNVQKKKKAKGYGFYSKWGQRLAAKVSYPSCSVLAPGPGSLRLSSSCEMVGLICRRKLHLCTCLSTRQSHKETPKRTAKCRLCRGPSKLRSLYRKPVNHVCFTDGCLNFSGAVAAWKRTHF